MSTINTLKKIKNFLPRYSLLVLYCAYVLPILDGGDIIYDNCTTTDSNLLESVQTAAAKLILCRLRTTSHEIILKELCLTQLFVCRQVHIPKAFRTILFGPCPSFMSALARNFLKNLSDYSSRFHTNVLLPSCKTHYLRNYFFIRLKTPEFSNHCPSQFKFTPILLQSIRFIPYQKTNA